MNIPVDSCSSCGACANICARGAISMQLDKEGFYRPNIDDSICSRCGACERICPWTNMVENPNGSSLLPRTIAAYAKDSQIRLKSSSGGIFSVLAEKILCDGGAVVGVAQLGHFHYGHIIVEDRLNLSKLQGSKYIQSDVGLIYQKVRTLLLEGRTVLFSGVPCQVAALYSVLGNKHFENLYTIDVVCHGIPSVKLYKKFAEKLSLEQNSTLSSTVFRDKSTGWKSYSVVHLFDNGEKLVIPHRQSTFIRMFLDRLCQNKSCTNCHYRKLPRIADITLGDYWNIDEAHPEMNDDKGTSVVLLNTNWGEKLFSSIAGLIEQQDSSLESAIAGNPCIVKSTKESFRRQDFFADLDYLSVDALERKYCVQLSKCKIALLKIRNRIMEFFH